MAQDTYNTIVSDLKSKYKKQTLSVEEVAKEIGVSSTTIRTSIKEGVGIPSFRQVGNGKLRKKYVFPVNEVAKFLADTQRVY